MDFGKVAVLMGGFSAEREVSLNSGQAILAALQSKGINAHAFDPAQNDLQELKKQQFNCAFNILHGTYGEDGVVQGALEALGIRYTGCGVLASALGMDKYRCKLLWTAMDLPVPKYVVVNDESNFTEVVEQLGLPLFLKPAAEGSSVGVYKVKSIEELMQKYQHLRQQKLHGVILAEQAITGGEYTCAILNKSPLPTIRIIPKMEFYDYQAKYQSNDTVYLCPSDLNEQQEQQMRSLALQAFHAIDGRGCGRVDFLKDELGNLFILEVNTVPGMTEHSLLPKAAQQMGIDFADLCIEILKTAYEV